MIVMVAYDLNNPNKNYTPLFEALKQQGPWWHYLKSTWLIDTNKTPLEVWNSVCMHIETTDRMLVTTIGPGHQGWLTKDAWDWISARKGL